ncbi:hypothetical protein ES708_28517 [subsurface metagenome]
MKSTMKTRREEAKAALEKRTKELYDELSAEIREIQNIIDRLKATAFKGRRRLLRQINSLS